jgi:predicted chitinase
MNDRYITMAKLNEIMPNANSMTIIQLGRLLNKTIEEFKIIHIAAFLARIALDSRELSYIEEESEELYKGRGLLKIKGREMYHKCSIHFDKNFMKYPEVVANAVWCCRTAGWYWCYQDTDLDQESSAEYLKFYYKAKEVLQL